MSNAMIEKLRQHVTSNTDGWGVANPARLDLPVCEVEALVYRHDELVSRLRQVARDLRSAGRFLEASGICSILGDPSDGTPNMDEVDEVIQSHRKSPHPRIDALREIRRRWCLPLRDAVDLFDEAKVSRMDRLSETSNC
jgi:hypothetical protein